MNSQDLNNDARSLLEKCKPIFDKYKVMKNAYDIWNTKIEINIFNSLVGQATIL